MQWKNIGHRLSIMLMMATLSTYASSKWIPFAGISSGPNKTYAAPVSSVVYTIEDIRNGNINGGCISNIRGLEDDEVGKISFSDYPSSCGAASLPARWKPGMVAQIFWQVGPYSDWYSRILPGRGIVHDPKEHYIIMQYEEKNQAIIPLPPPPEGRMDFDKASGIIVHFLPCNQIFITYGAREDFAPEKRKRDFEREMAMFRKSLTLCKKRPVIKSMADYYKHKPEMDAIKAERAQIPQVILPDYIKQLEAEGKLPTQQAK